ncbi:MAG: glycosyltransferase family 2 protein [Candidatus Woesebacteria bacterium]|nr:MAG: glycosyltransferase family 2 protein [Candidatus Woesebacteria bacterium]
MAKLIQEISVFLPTYNEESNIGLVIVKTTEVLKAVAEKWELLIINDGSTDSTREVALTFSKFDKNIRLVDNEKNMGYGAALASGFYNSKYEWIAFIDSDGQFDLAEIVNFIEKQRNTKADLVIGYYVSRKVSFGKKITSRMWETLVYLLFGLKVHDIDCGFKLISKKVLDKISKLESERGAFVSSELLIKAKKAGFKIEEVPVTHYPRIKGVGTGRNINVILKSFADLFRLWRKLK